MADTLTASEPAAILERALVPEHSVLFMQAMSGGRAFCLDDFLFLAADDWLMGIGYPLGGAQNAGLPQTGMAGAETAKAFEAALGKAIEKSGASTCWAVAPLFPERLEGFVENRDEFYVLGTDAPIPKLLRGPVGKAAARLRVSEDRQFTPAHRQLWAEFLSRVSMRPNVRELYARTEAVLAASRAAEQRGEFVNGRLLLDMRLLNAWDEQGNLAASLLLDYSPRNFCAYIIGAHSRRHYSPHATDLLFAAMLERGRAEGKGYLHLGLGVNPGIARFKSKWGAEPALPYAMASWREGALAGGVANVAGEGAKKEISEALRGFLEAPPGLSKQQIFNTFPKQRDFSMIREVRKGDALSYLCGTAHFFCYSFEMSFRRIFEPLHTIIFEGPLDEGFLADVEAVGRAPEAGEPRLIDALAEEEIRGLEGMVYGPEGFWARFMGVQHRRIVDVRHLLAHTRPWFAFFSLWVAFLERQGWSQSVDLEAWGTAKDMGKAVIGMESLEEQVASLEAVPFGRIIDFLRRCNEWPAYMKRNIRTYLDGDLMRMMGTSIEFPSRTEMVIGFRDGRFFERMRPFMEAGNCAVFVGTAHLLGITPMLEQAGFTVRPAYPSTALKLRAKMRGLFGARADG